LDIFLGAGKMVVPGHSIK